MSATTGRARWIVRVSEADHKGCPGEGGREADHPHAGEVMVTENGEQLLVIEAKVLEGGDLQLTLESLGLPA
jgi:hypothetical protein